LKIKVLWILGKSETDDFERVEKSFLNISVFMQFEIPLQWQRMRDV
jgi:hypothetical protein